MIARSLRARLLAGAAAAIFAALALAWLAMSYLFESHLERSIESSLIQHGRDLAAGLAQAADGALTLDPAPVDPRFDIPASGLYWQAGVGARALRSRSLWDEALTPNPTIEPEDWATGDANGPFGQRLIFAARLVRLSETGAPIAIMLAADHAAVSQARGEFSRELAMFLGLLWAVLSAAAWLQVHLGLKPLEDVRVALQHLRGQPNARLRDADYPTEAAPLAQAINALVEARERDLEQARRRAADLAHSLKTPLSALAAQSRRAREAGAGDAADGLDRALDAAHGAVERELARTWAAAQQHASPTLAAPVIDRLISVVERTEGGARLHFDNELGALVLPAAEPVLMEIAGPLLENAARFARARVRASGAAATLWVEDDGPGLSDAEAAAVLERGQRLDEGGHGLGLAIAREVAGLSGAELRLSRSALGGLRVEVRWPTLP